MNYLCLSLKENLIQMEGDLSAEHIVSFIEDNMYVHVEQPQDKQEYEDEAVPGKRKFLKTWNVPVPFGTCFGGIFSILIGNIGCVIELSQGT